MTDAHRKEEGGSMTTKNSKEFQNARAHAALNMIELYETERDDGRLQWVATRWAQTRAFDSTEELTDWLAWVTRKKVGASV